MMRDIATDLEKSISREFKKINVRPEDFGQYSMDMNNTIKSILPEEEDFDDFFEEITKEEAKEATGAGSSGGYEAPLFSEPKKNNLFQPGTESKLTTKPKGGHVNEDEIPGGLAKGMSLKDIEKKHNVESLKDELEKGIETELEHTTSKEIAKEIAMDHLFEDPRYYTKIEKIEAKEATTASSSGPYDVPFGGPKKNPLKLSNPDTVYKELRSVRDPKFPKLGGPGSINVKISNKCKMFPYCNQGDIKALEFFKNNLVAEAVDNISKKYSLHENYIKGVILENTNIYYKSTDMNKKIENIIDGIVDKVLSEEVTKKAEQITESVLEEVDEMAEFYEIAHKRRQERAEKVIGVDSNIEDQRKEMGEEDLGEQNAFIGARCKAGCGAKKGEENKAKFEVNGKTHEVTDWSDEDRESCGCDDTVKESIQLTEEEMIDLIEKIIEEQKISGGGKIQGVTTQNKAMKTSEKETKDYHKELIEKFKAYLNPTNVKGIEVEPKVFPKGNGEFKKMEKMAYIPSKGVEEYIDQIARSGGMENLEYDQIKPNEDWLDINIVGSSKTGNSDEYANAVATDVNKSVKKRKDDNILAKLKAKSYNKAIQPITDIAGPHTNDEEFAGIQVAENENKVEKKKVKINEDVDRIKKLFSYSYKTQ